MINCTGCISVGAPSATAITIDRIVEFFDPRPTKCAIWVDVYIANLQREATALRILHRGNLRATSVTAASWQQPPQHGEFAATLSDRIRKLHEQRYQSYRSFEQNIGAGDPRDPSTSRIIAKDNKVLVGLNQYALSPATPTRIVGTDEPIDIPYTMWEINEIDDAPRSVVRLKLEMSPASYKEQIGQGEFQAYGETILLDKIRYDDLPSFRHPEAEAYHREFATFLAGTHLVPAVFEFLLVAPDDEALGWTARPLGGAQQPITYDASLARTTQWFVADIQQTAAFNVSGKSTNSLALSVYRRIAA